MASGVVVLYAAACVIFILLSGVHEYGWMLDEEGSVFETQCDLPRPIDDKRPVLEGIAVVLSMPLAVVAVYGSMRRRRVTVPLAAVAVVLGAWVWQKANAPDCPGGDEMQTLSQRYSVTAPVCSPCVIVSGTETLSRRCPRMTEG